MQTLRPPALHASAAVRTLVLWLIALVLPFDGAAVGAQALRGSLHVHRSVAASALRLVDFRRDDVGPSIQAQTARAHVGAQRHRHAFADASVVVIGDDGADADHGAASVLAALVALPTGAFGWLASALPSPAPWCPPWAPSSGRTDRLERPPRVG